MDLDPAAGAVLRQLHTEFLDGDTPRSRAIGPAARALGVLPITDDWEFDLGIRITDGEVIVFNRDPPHDPQVEPFSRRWLSLLNLALWKHPELRVLVPPRPNTALDCEFCEGRGEYVGQDGIPRLCRHCILGWVPAELAK